MTSVFLTKTDLIALIKGLHGYESYTKAGELDKLGAGSLIGFPNERWEWNDKFFQVRSEEQLYKFYQLLKSWIG